MSLTLIGFGVEPGSLAGAPAVPEIFLSPRPLNILKIYMKISYIWGKIYMKISYILELFGFAEKPAPKKDV